MNATVPTWAPVILALAVQIIGIAFFFGKYSQLVSTLVKQVDRHEEAIEELKSMKSEFAGFSRKLDWLEPRHR